MATAPPPAEGHRYVVQRHRARRLHYDVRLEAAGVLVSWAVPKGPTLDPDVKRMAVHVEDHPLDYFDFEGVIPSGEYGGGDVIVWDWGTWSLTRGDDPVAAVAAGDVHVELRGEKLAGRFALVRRGDGRDQWLLIKKHDDAARPGWDPEDHPRSVKSGRTSDEVRDAPSATWSSETVWAAPSADELTALDELRQRGTWGFGGTRVALRGLDRVVVPAGPEGPAITKRDLVRHHAVWAPVMLPYLHDRHFVDLPGAAIDSPAALVEVVAAGTIGLHPRTTSLGDPEHPTWVVMEITAPDHPEDLLVLARLHRTALEHLDVDARPVLIGDDQAQIWIPVAARYTAAEIDRWATDVSTAIAAAVPAVAGRVHLGVADRLVAPFSVRPSPGAPVAVPVDWAELDDPRGPWTIGDVGERVERAGDPLAPLIGRRQRLPELSQ